MSRITDKPINIHMSVAYRREPSEEKDISIHHKHERVQNTASNVLIPHKDELLVVNKSDIMYVHAQGSYTDIILSNHQKYTLSKSINDWLQTENISFIRCHKSYAVNPQHVVAVRNRNQLRLTTDDLIPVSRRQFQETLNALKKLK